MKKTYTVIMDGRKYTARSFEKAKRMVRNASIWEILDAEFRVLEIDTGGFVLTECPAPVILPVVCAESGHTKE